MRVLAACEFSGTVREAFRRRGHDAWSCDLEPSERGNRHHFQADVRDVLQLVPEWDLLIGFPPCTHLCLSGARWWPEKQLEQKNAAEFFLYLATFGKIPRRAIENPVGFMNSSYRKPDQIIHPWQFGHGEVKATCLWLHGLPKLKPTDIHVGREARIHRMAPGPNRGKERSRFYTGIAEAMAEQWSAV